MKQWYRMTATEIFQEQKFTMDGLTTEQANEIQKEKGENMLLEAAKKSALQVFFEQFKDMLVIILIIAAAISMFSSHIESTIVIVSVIILNAILGTVQHLKAEKSLESLKLLSSPNAKVLRDGKKVEILSRDVVPGDILLLEAGDLVAADGRILRNYSLQVNESSLTGESTNVDKSDETITEEVGLGDRINMVFSGSLVTYGRATVLITEIGMSTEIGKIAGLMNDTKEKKTPLQISLDNFSKKLALIIMVICAFVFVLSMLRDMPVLDSLMFAVALAVAAIPEALGSIVTIVQAIGTQKMAKEQAIIKELKAVESLGSVSVICSDKTGTLTQNKMTVQQVYIDEKAIDFDEIDLKNQLHRYLLYDAILTNDASFHNGVAIGDPTEYALLEMARKIQVLDEEIRDMMPRLEELPFDSDRKLMSTKYELRGIPTILTKGALDVLLDRTIKIRTSAGIRDITEKDKENILTQNRMFSENGPWKMKRIIPLSA
ncbi:MAG: cation-translocating P-type ATPase [Herbinix sp.]|nr:cation-translocating P-type ATPase [Herbinix sp.]